MHFILNQNGELLITDEGEEVCELDETVEQVLKMTRRMTPCEAPRLLKEPDSLAASECRKIFQVV